MTKHLALHKALSGIEPRIVPKMVLAFYLTIGVAVLPAWSLVLRMTPIRPIAPKYVPIHKFGTPTLGTGLTSKLQGLSAEAAFGSVSISQGDRLKAGPTSAQSSENKVPQFSSHPLLSEKTPVFRLNDLAPQPPSLPMAVKDTHPALREFYAPAADLAMSRSVAAGNAAERARKDYEEIVGATLPADPVHFAKSSLDARQAAEQLANRMILAVLEDARKPSIFETKVSRETIQSSLVSALTNVGGLGSRPIGDRVWSDLLRQEYPPAVYRPNVNVSPTSDPGILNYRIDSWLLPSTQTPINVGVYSENAWISYSKERHDFFQSLRVPPSPGSWLPPLK